MSHIVFRPIRYSLVRLLNGLSIRKLAMQQEHSPLNAISLRRSMAALSAALLYLLSLFSVVWMPAVGGIVNSIALLILGTAVYWVTLAPLAPSAQRLSVPAQALWRRQRILAFAGVATVYLAL